MSSEKRHLNTFLDNIKPQLNLCKISFLKERFLTDRKFDNYLVLYNYMNDKLKSLKYGQNIISNKNINFISFLADENNNIFYFNKVFVTKNGIATQNENYDRTSIYGFYSQFMRGFNSQYTLTPKV